MPWGSIAGTRTASTITAAIIFVSVNSRADEAPKRIDSFYDAPGIPWTREGGNAYGDRVCKRRLPPGSLTLLGLRVNGDVVDKPEHVLGPSPAHSEGDASGSLRWRCWEAANGDGTVLVFGEGKMDGQAKLFGPEMAFAGRGKCPKSKLVTRTLATANGIHLAMTRAELEAKIGPPTKGNKTWYQRACWTKIPLTRKEREDPRFEGVENFDQSESVSAFLNDGKTVGLEWHYFGIYGKL